MSTTTDSAEIYLANEYYKYVVKDLYNVKTKTKYDLFRLKNILMILRALAWNDSNDYYTKEQVKLLESRISEANLNYSYL